MSLVKVPLSRAGQAGPSSPAVRAMEAGQHIMAFVLTWIGVIRAIGDSTPPPLAIGVGLALLAWHTGGSLLLARKGQGRLVIWWLVGFLALWMLATAVSAEFVWVAFLLWLLAGHLLPIGWGLAFSVAVFAVVIVAPILHYGATTYADVFGPLVGGVFAFGISRGYLQLLRDADERERLVASLTRAQAETAELQDELAEAQRHSGAVAERTRISRDIHDTIAQSLSSIRLLAHAQAAQTGELSSARTLSQIEALCGDGLADVRRIVAAMAPAELEDDALTAALRRQLERLHDEAGIDVSFRVDPTLPLLPTEVEVALLRTAQSALGNVRRHSQATQVVMSLIDADDQVRLDIIDNGIGFDVARWESRTEAPSSSFGLRFIRDRLRELGGGLDLESSPGEGTAFSAHLPVHRPKEDR